MSVCKSFLQSVGFIRGESFKLSCLGNINWATSALALWGKQEEVFTIQYVVYRLYLSLLFQLLFLYQPCYHPFRRRSGSIFPEIKLPVVSWGGAHNRTWEGFWGSNSSSFSRGNNSILFLSLSRVPTCFCFHSKLSCYPINSVTAHPSALLCCCLFILQVL